MINNSLFAHQLNYGLHEFFFLFSYYNLNIFLIQKKIIMQEINEILSLLLERFKTSKLLPFKRHIFNRKIFLSYLSLISSK